MIGKGIFVGKDWKMRRMSFLCVCFFSVSALRCLVLSNIDVSKDFTISVPVQVTESPVQTIWLSPLTVHVLVAVPPSS